MEWFDRDLQKKILTQLQAVYPNTLPQRKIAEEANVDLDKLDRNIKYLIEHKLIQINIAHHEDQDNSNSLGVTGAFPAITASGIDFLAQDGGLSAILNTVTIKLHNDTLQTILKDKIDQATISEAEKSKLKSSINTMKEAALIKITELAIEEIPVRTILSFLQKAISP